FVGLNVRLALGLGFPAGIGLIRRPLGENDVIVGDTLLDQPLRIGCGLLVTDAGIRRRKRGDDVRIAPLQIPEVVEISIGENNEAAILRTGVFTSLFLADQWILVLRLGFENDK